MKTEPFSSPATSGSAKNCSPQHVWSRYSSTYARRGESSIRTPVGSWPGSAIATFSRSSSTRSTRHPTRAVRRAEGLRQRTDQPVGRRHRVRARRTVRRVEDDDELGRAQRLAAEVDDQGLLDVEAAQVAQEVLVVVGQHRAGLGRELHAGRAVAHGRVAPQVRHPVEAAADVPLPGDQVGVVADHLRHPREGVDRPGAVHVEVVPLALLHRPEPARLELHHALGPRHRLLGHPRNVICQPFV